MKYKDCTSLADMANVNSNYLKQDIDDGCWFYQLPSLINGDNMFYNDDMTELYEGRVPLWHFESNLQSLQSGVNMFKGCSLDAASIKRIADTLPDVSTGTITLGIHCSLEGDSGVVTSLTKIENKGWSVETEYNLPYGFTELEYLKSSGTQYIDTLSAPNNATGMIISYKATSRSDYMTIGAADLIENVSNVVYPLRWDAAGMNVCHWGAGQGYTGNSTEARAYHHWESSLNWKNDRWSRIVSMDDGFEGKVSLASLGTPRGSGVIPQLNTSLYFFGRNQRGALGFAFSGHVYFVKISQGSAVVQYFVPVLDAKGTPCMFEKISRKCFYNKGKGTFGYRIKTTGAESAPFSLRDPYYVAPSGIYARLAAENELDIVADTDMKEDVAEQEGYIWFANTGEAYEHFDITQQPAEGEVIDA